MILQYRLAFKLDFKFGFQILLFNLIWSFTCFQKTFRCLETIERLKQILLIDNCNIMNRLQYPLFQGEKTEAFLVNASRIYNEEKIIILCS